MIPGAFIQEWPATTPWPDPRHVEQDRSSGERFATSSTIRGSLSAWRSAAGRRSTSSSLPLRYSEDIDLVQVRAEPIGPTVDMIRRVLSCLGPCRRKAAAHSMHLVFTFAPEADPTTSLKLKVEINAREHGSLFELRDYPFAVDNGWHAATTSIRSYEPAELFGTKLRALLQRSKNRDLFDLNEGLLQLSLNAGQVIAAFDHYLAHAGHQISRANAEERMLSKLTRSLVDDIAPLLAADVVDGDAQAQTAFERVWFHLIARLTGEPWHRSEPVIDELRATSFPELLRERR